MKGFAVCALLLVAAVQFADVNGQAYTCSIITDAVARITALIDISCQQLNLSTTASKLFDSNPYVSQKVFNPSSLCKQTQTFVLSSNIQLLLSFRAACSAIEEAINGAADIDELIAIIGRFGLALASLDNLVQEIPVAPKPSILDLILSLLQGILGTATGIAGGIAGGASGIAGGITNNIRFP